jgi:hypothetical protein
VCSVHESAVDCPECQANPCNSDGVCQPTRGENDGNCPGDCPPTCAGNADCSPGSGNICDKLEGELCSLSDPNCAADQQQVCRLSCSQTADCGAGGGGVCVKSQVNQQNGACEQPTCSQSPECSASRLCTKPVEMTTDDGFCLARCSPQACNTGGACACDGAVFDRCGTARDGAGDVVDFVCTSRGQLGPNIPCTFEGDCGPGLTCADNVCRQFCFNPGQVCNGGPAVCTELLPGVGFCPQ